MVEGWVAQLQVVPGVELVVFPPHPYLGLLSELLRQHAPYAAFGAQDVHEQASGAFTGETSAEMVADLGGRYAIVGHSERRRYSGETDDRVARKVRATLRAGLTAIVCVGETLEERSRGEAQEVVKRQLLAVSAELGAKEFAELIVAYEPVWAIGTGKSASTAQIEEMHAYIRDVRTGVAGSRLPSTVLYGGSVSEANADSLFGSAQVDGALVGGAALVGERFVEIARRLHRAEPKG